MRYIKKSSKNVKERVYTAVRGSTKIVIELFRSPRKSWKLACATSPEISSQKPSLLHQAWPQEHDNVLKLVQVCFPNQLYIEPKEVILTTDCKE